MSSSSYPLPEMYVIYMGAFSMSLQLPDLPAAYAPAITFGIYQGQQAVPGMPKVTHINPKNLKPLPRLEGHARCAVCPR